MTLSTQVEDSLLNAQTELRNALSFSARTEKPYVSKHIADMMHDIDNLLHVVPLLDRLEEVQDGIADS
jgi:hypothetical protein|tara:strand:+ start:261 stop:464 length:204 start_codon:yes stop_codon:yes gene_type:complete